MDNDHVNEDILRINALVDGELAPAERAGIAARLAADRDLARAHATLARLKACVIESANDRSEIALSLPQAKPFLPPRGRIAAFAATAAFVAVLALGLLSSDRQSIWGEDSPVTEAVTLAALPPGAMIPTLDLAGLKLVEIVIKHHSGVAVAEATYRGPHGCRLDLRARPAGISVPAMTGSSRREWEVGDIAYELVAHGMPQWRFSIIAEATEQQTRQDGIPRAVERRLREASASPPPCAG